MLVAYMYHVTSINQIRPPLLALRWGRAWTSPTSARLETSSRPWAEPWQSRDRQSQNLALLAVSSSVICLPEFYIGRVSRWRKRARNESSSRNHSPKSPVLLFYTFICRKYATVLQLTLHRICCTFGPKYAKICASIYKNAPASGGLPSPRPPISCPPILVT